MDVVINAELVEAPVCSTPLPHQRNYYHHIFSCLLDSSESPPVADLLRKYYGLEGHWLIASPIYWQATHNDAMIVACGQALELSESDSLRWYSALAQFVKPYNINLHYHDAYTRLINVDNLPQITAKSVYTLLHQSLLAEIRALDPTLFWQRFITESQMFFSAHPLNKERGETNPINGIWIWGDGKLLENHLKPLVCQNDELLKLAQLLSTKVSGYSPSAPISKNSLFLFGELNPSELHVLELQSQKHTVRWYWNNIAYLTKPKSWISRLIKGL